MSAQIATTRFVPTPDQYAWTFGGCEPVMRVRPGDVLELFTEDAFAGAIRSSAEVNRGTSAFACVNVESFKSASDSSPTAQANGFAVKVWPWKNCFSSPRVPRNAE